MKVREYVNLKVSLNDRGYYNEIQWAQDIKPCSTSDHFAFEAIWVIISAGLKNQVARKIEKKLFMSLEAGQSVLVSIGHKGKAKAIDYVLNNKTHLYEQFQNAENKTDFLETLPWIGPITKYHLAKNLGVDTCKPDRHLSRIAAKYNSDPFTFCKELSRKTGDKIAVVDQVLWRAANLGLI